MGTYIIRQVAAWVILFARWKLGHAQYSPGGSMGDVLLLFATWQQGHALYSPGAAWVMILFAKFSSESVVRTIIGFQLSSIMRVINHCQDIASNLLLQIIYFR